MATLKSSKDATDAIGVIILVFAVAVGVVLVGQEQHFRNKAKELKEHKVVICHNTSSEQNLWVEIEVSESSLKSHIDHGDILGSCPQPDTGGKSDDSDGGGGDDAADQLATVTNINVVNEIQNPTETVRVEYIYSGPNRFDFYVRFQGIDTRKPDKNLRVILRKGEDEMHIYNNVVASSNDNGVYKASISDIGTGTYDVFVKGNAHLQRKFGSVYIGRGITTRWWLEEELLAGDFNNDNIIDSFDIASLLSEYTSEIVDVNLQNAIFDVDMSGDITNSDINLVLANYDSFEVEGEE